MRALVGAVFTQLRLGLDQSLPPDPLFDLNDASFQTPPPRRLKKRQYLQNKESIDNQIFRVYRIVCQDMDPIPLTAELEMFEVGRVAIERGADDASLAKVLRAYAESMRF